MKMISVLPSALVAAVVIALATPALAADKTITGEAKCSKCTLKETDKCGTVIDVESKNGKTTRYYLVDNDVAKGFHDTICKEPKKVTAVGTVEKVGDKREFTASKITVAP